MLHWSSPIRQLNGQELSSIPNELYLEIFAYIRPAQDASNNSLMVAKRTLSKLALVCRFFSSVVLPWIFERCCFDGEQSDTYSSDWSFCRSIVQGQGTARTMAQFVKRCSFWSWTDNGSDDWSRAEFLRLYTDALVYMPNIQEISWTHSTITKAVLKATGRLQKLSTLTLEQCAFASLEQRHFNFLSSLKLKSCQFRTHVPDDLVRAINFDTVLHYTVYGPCFPSSFLGSHNTLPLETLEATAIPYEAEWDVLISRAPLLKSLCIHLEHALPRLPEITEVNGAFPALETLACILPMAQFWTPGRPISSITIFGQNRVLKQSDIDALLKSTRPVTHLGTSLQSLDFPFWKHFPALESLELIICPDYLGEEATAMDDVTEIWKKWPPLPSIQIVTFNYVRPLQSEASITQQRRWISQIRSLHFPAMRHFVVKGSHDRHWYYSDSSASWILETGSGS